MASDHKDSCGDTKDAIAVVQKLCEGLNIHPVIVESDGSLRIPFGCAPEWRWWDRGKSLEEIRKEVGGKLYPLP